MLKLNNALIVVALMGIIGSNLALAKEKKAFRAGGKEYSKVSADAAAKVSGKPIKGISDVHEKYEKPVRQGGCDKHMGGCIDH